MNTRLPIPSSLGVLLAAILVVGCADKTPQVAESPPPAVTVSKPVEREVVNYDEYEGRIAPVMNVEVRARVRGHLTKVAFEDGQIVKEGTPLFELDKRPFDLALKSAENEKAAAEARLELAKTEYKRSVTLSRSGAASREETDILAAKRDTTGADRQKAIEAVEKAKLDVEYTRIAAPITGRTSRSLADVGNLINAGGGETLLTTIVSIDPMHVYFNVDERSLLRYRKDFNKGRKDTGQDEAQRVIKDLKIPVEVALEGEDGHPHKGVIDFAENRVDAQTGTISVRGVLPNGKRILDAGMRARVRVPVAAAYKALMITERAIGTDQGLKFVYVVTADNVAKRRDVVLGRQFDGLRVIDKGLQPGDQVIVNGIQYVRPEMKVDPKPGEMPGSKAVAQP